MPEMQHTLGDVTERLWAFYFGGGLGGLQGYRASGLNKGQKSESSSSMMAWERSPRLRGPAGFLRTTGGMAGK